MRSVSQIFGGQNSYEQNMKDIHICARLSVEAITLNDQGVGWAAKTMEVANCKIGDLEKYAGPIVRNENERIKGCLRGQGRHGFDDFTIFEWMEEHVYLLGLLEEFDIDCGQYKHD